MAVLFIGDTLCVCVCEPDFQELVRFLDDFFKIVSRALWHQFQMPRTNRPDDRKKHGSLSILFSILLLNLSFFFFFFFLNKSHVL